MKTFKEIYPYEVFEKISEGKEVRILDKEQEKVFTPHDLTLEEYAEINKERNSKRYEFWTIEEITEESKE